jgi:hypothetical protein
MGETTGAEWALQKINVTAVALKIAFFSPIFWLQSPSKP